MDTIIEKMRVELKGEEWVVITHFLKQCMYDISIDPEDRRKLGNLLLKMSEQILNQFPCEEMN
jgi:hypothetical protein